MFRHFLDCYVLNPQCIDALEEGFDTCGWRLSPLPSPHYSGNYWWARCEYVNNLISPASMVLNETFATIARELSKGVVSQDRYFAEAWVTSHPLMHPADCMDHNMDTTFFCCYDLEYISPKECPNHAKHWFPSVVQDLNNKSYASVLRPLIQKNLNDNLMKNSIDGNRTLKIGGKCKMADTFIHGEYYAKVYAEKRSALEHAFGINLLDEIRWRSMLWYGQEPVALMNATSRLETLPSLPDRAIVCDRYDLIKCYYLRGGNLYDFTSMEYKIDVKLGAIERVLLPNFQLQKLLRRSTTY
jgi:hypothetical protein